MKHIQNYRIIIMVALFGVISLAYITPLKAQNTTADFVMSPPVTTVSVDDVFTVSVEIQAGELEIDTGALYIDFDPDVLEVQSITGQGPLDVPLADSFNNEEGILNYAAGKFGGQGTSFPSGTFAFVDIEFKAISGGAASLIFTTEFPRETGIASNGEGENVLGNVLLTDITVKASSLDVVVDGIISPQDAVFVINRLDTTNPQGDDAAADVNGDLVVDQTDLDLVIAALGTEF